jgi:hypothetical protein
LLFTRLALLCPSGEDRLRLNNKNKKTIFCFVLSSACTIFAFEKEEAYEDNQIFFVGVVPCGSMDGFRADPEDPHPAQGGQE